MKTANADSFVSKSDSSPEWLCSQISIKLASSAAELMAACQMVVTLLDVHQWTPDSIAKQAKLTPVLVRNLERVGRKHMAPELIWGETVGRRALAKLPMQEQERWLAAPLEVATTTGDVLQVSVDNLTPELCRQVFDGARVRSIGEQRAWLETAQRQKKPTQALADYEVRNHKLRINRGDLPPLELTRAQLVRALSEMEA